LNDGKWEWAARIPFPQIVKGDGQREIVIFLRFVLEYLEPSVEIPKNFEPKRFLGLKFGTYFWNKVPNTFFFTSEVDAELPLELRGNNFKLVGVRCRGA
jgi:hypothetical protein